MPVGHEQFGRSFPCPVCGGGPKVNERQRGAIKAFFENNWLHDSLKMAEFELSGFAPDFLGELIAGKEKAIQAARTWADGQMVTYEQLGIDDPTVSGFEPSAGIVISGQPGTGKTALACAAWRARVGEGVGLAIEYNSLMSALMSQINDDGGNLGAALETACKAPVLLLDDMGNPALDGQETPGRLRWIFEIINYRYNRNMPTLITTNLDYGWMCEQFTIRLAERLLSRWVWIEMRGESLRIRYAKGAG